MKRYASLLLAALMSLSLLSDCTERTEQPLTAPTPAHAPIPVN